MHVTSAQSIAKVAAQNGVSKLVHVSHLNASLDSKSDFYQTKAEGELAVKEAFSDATIIRPSIMFGYEDKLLNSMAGLSTVCAADVECMLNYSSMANVVEIERGSDQDQTCSCDGCSAGVDKLALDTSSLSDGESSWTLDFVI